MFIICFWFFSQVKNVTLHCLHLHLKTIKLKQLHKIGSWLSLKESFTFSFRSHAVDRLIFVFVFFFQAGAISCMFTFLKIFECGWFWIVHIGRNTEMYFLYSALIMRRATDWFILYLVIFLSISLGISLKYLFHEKAEWWAVKAFLSLITGLGTNKMQRLYSFYFCMSLYYIHLRNRWRAFLVWTELDL